MNHQQIITEVGSRYKQLDDAVKLGRLDLPTAVHNYAWLARKDLGPGHLAMGNLNAAQTKEANDSEASIPFVISTYSEDRDGDVVVSMGCRLHNYINNPVVFFGHQDNPLPIAKSMNPNGGLTVFPEENRIWAVAYFDKADEDAMNVYGKVKRGFLSATSIAFVPIVARRRDDIHKAHQHEGSPGGWIFDEIDTTEWSVVGVPSNPQATVLQKNLRGGLRDLVDSERRSTSPRLLKALEPYCAKSINESGGCWSGWCPTPQAKTIKPVTKGHTDCSCHAKTKAAPKKALGSPTLKALGDIQVGDHVWVDQFDRGKVTAIYNGKATIQFSDGTREEYPMARLDKGIKKTQLDMEHGTTAGEIDLTKSSKGFEQHPLMPKLIDAAKRANPKYDSSQWDNADYKASVRAAQQDEIKLSRQIAAETGASAIEVANYASRQKSIKKSADLDAASQRLDAAKRAFQAERQQPHRSASAKAMFAKIVQELQDAERAYEEAYKSSQGKSMVKYITVNGVRYKSMSESSGADGGYVVPPEQKASSPIRRGDVVKIKPEHQDEGDDKYKWVAIEDEDGGRVKLRPEGTGLNFPGVSVFQTAWLIKSIRTKSGPDVEYDQGYVAAWDGRARATNPYKNDNEGRGPEMRQDWDAGWVDGAKERLTGRKSAKRAVRKGNDWEARITNLNPRQARNYLQPVLDRLKKDRQQAVSAGATGMGNIEHYDEQIAALEAKLNQLAGKSLLRRKSCSFCRGTGSGCGRPGDCPTCAGKGWTRTKGKNMRRRKALEDEQTMGVDEPMVHPHESAIADLYKRAKDEHAYITEQLGSITPFDPQTGDANKAHADLKEYGDQVGQRLESLKAMFGAHSEKDLDEMTAEETMDLENEQVMELDDEEAMGLETSGDGIANTGEANLVDRGEVPPDAVEAGWFDSDPDMEDLLFDDEKPPPSKGRKSVRKQAKIGKGSDGWWIIETINGTQKKVAGPYATEAEARHSLLEYASPYAQMAEDDDVTKAAEDEQLEKDLNEDLDEDIEEATEGEDHATEEVLERYQEGGAKGWRTRKASTSRIAKVLRAGGSVKRGLDGRRWLVLRSVRKAGTTSFKITAAYDGYRVIRVSDGSEVGKFKTRAEAQSVADRHQRMLETGKSHHRKDLSEQDPNQVQLSLDPAHAEAIKACGSMMKGLAVAHDMPEHHKSALDMHGDALAKSLEEGGHEEAATKALKHMKSLKEAPDVPEHHKAAMGHHSKAMAKALKAMGAEEEAPVEEAEGDEEQIAKDDGSDQVSKALMDSLRDSALMLERTSHRVGIKV